jgi:DNA-binding NarL/FixJ family response regulator
MPITGYIQANALVLGLTDDLASELENALTQFCTGLERHDLRSEVLPVHAIASGLIQVVFCGPQPEVVRQIRATRADTAIIVVSRHTEVSDWLDAIEAGANDYCAAPFEPAQIYWLLESTLKYSQIAAA